MRAAHSRAAPKKLLADAELGDDVAITLDVLLLEVVEETTTTTNEHQKTTTAVVVILVGFEVLGQDVDALGEERNLDLG